MPAGRVNEYKTYAIRAPKNTHYRRASCEEVECHYYTKGWKTKVDESTSLGQRQAAYIRKESGRGFTETREGQLTVFTFKPGNKCFGGEHKVRLERPANFYLRAGDLRGNPSGEVTRLTLPNWVESWQENQAKLDDIIRKG